MRIMRILIIGASMVAGFVLAPLSFALIADSVNQSKSDKDDAADSLTTTDLLKSERDAIARYERNVQIIAVISGLGAVGGGALGFLATRPRRKVDA